MDGKSIELYSLNKYGVVLDQEPHLLPPEAWSNALNVRFTDDGVEPVLGYQQVFGTPSVTPEVIFNAPGLGASYWIYCSLTKAYVYDAGVHSNITRQSAGVDVNYAAVNGKAWNATILGGIPILNNYTDLPQYWTSLNPSSKLANLTNWPSTLRAKLIRAFGPYLVALNLLDNTTVLESAIQWSHKADPGTLPSSWDYTDPTVDAGRLQLTDAKGGAIVEAVLLGNLLVIYKEYSTHTLRFVGGQDILSPDLLFVNSGILTSKCACTYKKGTRHFVVTANDIITHAGAKDTIEYIADTLVRDDIFSTLDTDHFDKSFVFENEALSEVVFCYPTSGNTYPNKAAIWCYKEGRQGWSFRDWVGESVDVGAVSVADEVEWDSASYAWDTVEEPWSEQARLQLVASSRSAVKMYVHNTGYNADGTEIQAYVERTGIAIDGRDRMGMPRASVMSTKQASRIWPRFTGNVAVTVRLGAYSKPNDSFTYTSGVFNSITDEYIDLVATGKLLAIRYEISNTGAWRLTGHNLDITKLSDL